MKFSANTAPIVSGLDLGIITANITKFYQKSCIVELTIEENSLRVNTEVSAIKSELIFKGKVSGSGNSHIFVDSLLFKNLLKTIDTEIVEFEFLEDSLVVISGKSKFNLPQVISGEDLELMRPTAASSTGIISEINKDNWEFIKDQQMYAISMSFVHPVYTNAWMGENGDAIVGDFDNGIFTHSKKAQLDSTCLLTDTIINLLTNVPEDSQILSIGKNYLVKVETDPYSYLCEFSPKYEEDEGVGDYSSNIILSLFEKSDNYIELDIAKLSKYLSQAELFATTNDDVINVDVTSDLFKFYNEHVDCKIPVVNPFGDFSIVFKITLLKDLISHMDDTNVKVSPLIQGDEVSGILMWTNNMEAMLAGAEQEN